MSFMFCSVYCSIFSKCEKCFTFEINKAVSFFNNAVFLISNYRNTENATKDIGRVNKNTLLITDRSSNVFISFHTSFLPVKFLNEKLDVHIDDSRLINNRETTICQFLVLHFLLVYPY
jgi:hypothetical protein